MPQSLSVIDIRSDDYAELQGQAYANDVARLLARKQEFVEVPCPACDSPAQNPAFGKYGCEFVECCDCETLYMSPRPTPELMDRYYTDSENYRIWRQHIFPRSEATRRERIARPNLQYVIDTCAASGISSPRLLEIGPGFGTFAELALESRFFSAVEVVERNPDMADECARRGLTVHRAALEDLARTHQAFDVAVCFEVIEHVFDPLHFVTEIAGLLRPGGLFIFTCPNGKGFDTLSLGAASPAVDTEHVNLFNPLSIRALLRRAGLHVLLCDTPGKLDADIVRRAIQAGELDVPPESLLQHVLVESFEQLGQPFQSFLVDCGMSGNMRITSIVSAESVKQPSR